MTIDELIALIRRSPVQKSLFHFTATQNLSTIRRDGLLSRRALIKRNINHETGGNQLSRDLDDQCGLDAYVHLYCRQQYGMLHTAQQDGRLHQTSWISVAPDVLALPGVLIAPDNSVKNGVETIPASEIIDQLDLEILYQRTDWKNPAIQARLRAAERYEILVPDAIANAYLTF